MNKSNLKGYKIDFATKTLTMNYKFSAAAKQYGSPEYKLIKQIQSDFPTISIITRVGRNITTPRPTKRMTYSNMIKYISAYENADELLNMFETVKKMSAPLKSPYKYVHDWFVMQFPNYKEAPKRMETKLHIIPVAAPNLNNYEMKDDTAA